MSSLKGSFLLFILLQLFLFIPSPVLASDIIDSWTQDSPLTQPIANHPSFSFGNYLYTLGGSTSDDFSLIQRLDIFSSGPSRIWSHISDLNEPLYWHAAILKSNRAYTIGGTQYPPQTSVNSSKSATINGSGTISLWIPTTPLPQRLSKGVAAISGNYIYFAGGWTDSEGVGSASNKVYYAPINLDGTLGSWNTTTDLPGVYWSHRMVESNGFLYILGGFKNGSRTSDVIRAQVNSVDGTLSGWTNMLPLPNDIESFGVVRIEDYIITVAGGSTAGLTKKVYYSQINNDGSLAGWQTSAAELPEPHCCGGLAEANGYLYLTGGYADGYTSSLYKAKINLVFPTPTPTPTPTDTPVARVFVIPGMGASWNADAMLNCKDEGYAGNWELAPYAEDIYNPLLQALNRSGHGVTPYYYDWRKDVRSHVPTLESLIQSQSSNSYLVGHSMGGLLGRAYLEVMRENSHLDKLLTVASPHQGAVTAYPAWSAGKIWEGNLVSRIALSIILNRCGSNTHEAIVNHVPAVQNLLPTFDYLYHKKDGQFLTVDTMVAQNNFSPTNLSVPFWGVNLGTLSGHGKETLYRLDIKDPSHSDDRLGIWTDGNPLKRYSNRNGDGTVLVSSSQISGADNRLVDNKNHLQIVSSAQGINQILDFLGMTTVLTSTLTSLESPEPNSALIILSPDSEVTFESGQNAKSAPGISVIFSPTRKDYRFLIKSKKQRSKMIVAQFLPDNSYLWKEYQLSPNQRSGYLKYDPNKIGNNILNW